MESVPFSEAAIKAADCVVVVTDHSGIDYGMVRRAARAVVDTRHILPRSA
jgi:UDP-N-acetyl-D-mannosaminuronate dehydrogenase